MSTVLPDEKEERVGVEQDPCAAGAQAQIKDGGTASDDDRTVPSGDSDNTSKSANVRENSSKTAPNNQLKDLKHLKLVNSRKNQLEKNARKAE